MDAPVPKGETEMSICDLHISSEKGSKHEGHDGHKGVKEGIRLVFLLRDLSVLCG